MSVIARKSVHLCCVWDSQKRGGGGGFIGDSWDIGRKGPWSYPGISPVNVPISSTFSRAMFSSAKGMRKNGFTEMPCSEKMARKRPCHMRVTQRLIFALG